MAKKKMTFEEKLEEAIVKDAPYEVPDNWIWSNVGSISLEIKNGTTIKQNKDEIGIKVTRIESLQNNGIDLNRLGTIIETEKIKEQDYYIDGDIALSHINSLEHVGKTALIDNSLLPLVHGMNLLRIRVNKRMILPKYFQLYTRGYDYKKFVVDRVNRAVNQVSLNQKNLSDVPMPIPPLKEQHRIVDKIESLFEKLDKAKELIEEVRDDFEKRKSAILEKAFRGELTKAWRSNNLVDYNSTWTKHVFSNIAKVKSNLVQPQDFLKYPHIAPDNIEKKTGKLLAYRTIEEDNVKSAKHRFYPGQIIYSKIRPYLSKVVIVDFEGLCSADMYPIETDLDTKYLYYYMLSDTFIDFASNSGSRSVLPKINQKELGKINVPVCSINEQKEIVRILDSLLEEESKIEELTKLDDQIELIKKSILAKAFRGQLGTNSEDDESAIELLKEILNK